MSLPTCDQHLVNVLPLTVHESGYEYHTCPASDVSVWGTRKHWKTEGPATGGQGWFMCKVKDELPNPKTLRDICIFKRSRRFKQIELVAGGERHFQSPTTRILMLMASNGEKIVFGECFGLPQVTPGNGSAFGRLKIT